MKSNLAQPTGHDKKAGLRYSSRHNPMRNSPACQADDPLGGQLPTKQDLAISGRPRLPGMAE
jgi:hypothetical protein